ncbi:DUF4333 domain-containing protein [Streptomyces sp. T-3]|nr:DUF4333 domain-containing protein [Streptomyces sp. T-3]
MLKTRLFTIVWALSAATAGGLLVGCSASVSVGSADPKVPKDKLANTVAEKLAATTGQPKPDVTCPKDLIGKVGSTARCTLAVDDGGALGVTVKVSSADGENINYDIKVDDTPSPATN